MPPVDVNGLFEAVGTLAENAALQADFYQAMASRLVEIEKLVRNLAHHANTFYVGDHLAVTRVVDHFLMYADTRDLSITPHLLIDGEWEPHVKKVLLQFITPGMTVVDVGANFGYFTLLAAQVVGPKGLVYAFEPHPRSFEILQKNIVANWYVDRIRSFPFALLDGAKQLDMHTTPSLAGGNSFFVTQMGGLSLDESIAVTAKTLDEVVSGRVDVMKIDAEGSEPFIIEGMKGVLARSPQIKIVMEFNPQALQAAGKDPRQFLRRLAELGFVAGMVTLQGDIEPPDESVLDGDYIHHTLVLFKG
jgi:FkbM family methyltransferase